MLRNKKLNPIVTEVFIRGSKPSCLYYIILFSCAKKQANSTHCVIMKNPKQTGTSAN